MRDELMGFKGTEQLRIELQRDTCGMGKLYINSLWMPAHPNPGPPTQPTPGCKRKTPCGISFFFGCQPTPAQAPSPAQPSQQSPPKNGFNRNNSVKTFGRNVIGTHTLNNFYGCHSTPAQAPSPAHPSQQSPPENDFKRKNSVNTFRSKLSVKTRSKLSVKSFRSTTFGQNVIGTQTLNNFYKRIK